jgi:hypothetical protein
MATASEVNKDFLNECIALNEAVNTSSIEQYMPFVKHAIKGAILSGQRLLKVNKGQHNFASKVVGPAAMTALLDHLRDKEGFEVVHDPPGYGGYADIKW